VINAARRRWPARRCKHPLTTPVPP
jgi:hypothetical protein